MRNCITLILLLVGCSHNSQGVDISLGRIKSESAYERGYNKKLDSFQYLFRHEAEEMLNDLKITNTNCKTNFILDLELGYKNLYGHVKQSNSLNKKSNFYKLNYQLRNIMQPEQEFSGEITSIDSFVVPSSAYAYTVSTEDSQTAVVSNLVKQLESEIVYLLHNNCK